MRFIGKKLIILKIIKVSYGKCLKITFPTQVLFLLCHFRVYFSAWENKIALEGEIMYTVPECLVSFFLFFVLFCLIFNFCHMVGKESN